MRYRIDKRRIAAPWPTNINYINIWPRMRNPLNRDNVSLREEQDSLENSNKSSNKNGNKNDNRNDNRNNRIYKETKNCVFHLLTGKNKFINDRNKNPKVISRSRSLGISR